MTSIIRIFLLLIFSSCNQEEAYTKGNEIKSEGVLVIGSVEHYQLNGTLEILNFDGKVFNKIYKDKNSEIKTLSDSLSIRGFYPDYDIIIFDARKKNNEYQVLVNNKWKKIEYKSEFTFYLWSNFISQIYLGLKKESPLYSDKNSKSKIIDRYTDYYYEVIEIDGEWLKVRCWKDCEGCPENNIIEGWVKWRKKKQLLVDLFYIC